MTKKREMRTFNITSLSKRDGTNEQPPMISGYASVFNSKTSIGDYFEEVIAPGAFARSLAENDVRALFNHNWDKVLGRTKSGTLRLMEDERGLKFEVELPNTTAARDLVESMERKDIDQCSFGFIATEEDWNYSVEPALRTVIEADLFEISVVSIPAYDDTEAALVRSKEIDRSVEKRIKILNQIKGVMGNE
ncbi:HK97 family phage prohead protease [Heyndrickxia oleronia]|jgi:HK97 family phage prohead protease|uniref:HK97 family phage prohead protease n=1 Tax=Heyndrickxia oleronia TaxID=38875 RepID=UPI0024310921|nr:HK97 family phage prohead protease [Heyndrickxia oleronia]MCI1592480.1 HK97 family phage prohead protease [Heyndrickxia oleronia]MCI1615441.1 HK97 family phage prohead protease [Heyndrickxia oleronia]MCI1746295.1 HK97 family phage prohead protease [Heyndrickxia oleronia]MCI1763592.1 HK97 family phage prohead protease [Heyndrickxia oleronia]